MQKAQTPVVVMMTMMRRMMRMMKVAQIVMAEVAHVPMVVVAGQKRRFEIRAHCGSMAMGDGRVFLFVCVRADTWAQAHSA